MTLIDRRSVLKTMAGLGAMALLGGPRSDRLEAAGGTKLVFFLLDGGRADTLAKLCDEGKLPTLAWMRERGLWVDHAVSVFPSTTGPAYAPFIDGLTPATSGLAGIRQLVRRSMTYRVYCGQDAGAIKKDLNPSVKTIFEMLPPDESLSVFGMIDRGVKRSTMCLIDFLRDKLTGDYLQMDVHSMDGFRKLLKKGLPAFSFVSLHALDSFGHKEGVDGENYRRAMIQADRLIGQWLREMHQAGRLGELTIAISADHGLDSTHHHGDLAKALRTKLGLKVQDALGRFSLAYNLKSALRFGSSKFSPKQDAVIAVSGNACVQIYLRGNGGRADAASRFDVRPTLAEIRSYRGLDGHPRGGHLHEPAGLAVPGGYSTQDMFRGDLITTLLEEPCVGLVIARDGPRLARIFTRRGESVIERDGDRIGYRVIRGADPLQMRAAARLADGALRQHRVWLQHTAGETFPDAPYQITELLRADDSGDLIINAAPDYEPWTEGQKGVHGGIDRGQLEVPLFLWGRGVPRGRRLGAARTVDLFPTMLGLLDLPVPAGLPGTSLI